MRPSALGCKAARPSYTFKVGRLSSGGKANAPKRSWAQGNKAKLYFKVGRLSSCGKTNTPKRSWGAKHLSVEEDVLGLQLRTLQILYKQTYSLPLMMCFKIEGQSG